MGTSPIDPCDRTMQSMFLDLRGPSSYVAHGSLRVEPSIDRDFNAVETYLRGDSIMRRTFDHLEHARQPTYVVEDASTPRCADAYQSNERRIWWNPTVAHHFADGGRQSPALALAHEAAHADESDDARARLASHNVPKYDNAEERRVIAGPESHAARSLGESVRHSHRATAYHVDNPTHR